ncbi:MAG: VTT domain-containing protein [Sulfuritalea sp.]|nr:VTT domain-containing protein [Sulfuritalea sp.]
MKRLDAKRAALILALAAGLVLAFANRQQFSQEALQLWLASAGWWAPVLFIGLYAAGTVLFLPGSVLTLAAGALFGILPGALYSLAGATLGAVLAFLVARHLAGNWVAQKTGGRLKQLIEGVEAEGWHFVAFVRLVPLFPFNVVNYALGLTRIPLGAYALASAVCMLPGALAYAWLGHAGRAALAGDADAIRNGMLALAVAAALMFLPRLVRQFKAGLMITPAMLRALQRDADIAVVDVRDAADFDGETGHVPGALNLPLGELPARIAELEPWRANGVVLICRTQVRSRQAARLLARQGFSGLRVVRGGILAWRELGYPTEGKAITENSLGLNNA